MEKVYLLLRNNKETGPFTIQELLLQKLSPTDMIWVEGKSTAWTFLNEMELNFHQDDPVQHISDAPRSKHIGDEIEQKADEIRKRALSYKPRPLVIHSDPSSNDSSYSGGFLNADDTIEIINHNKEKNKTFNEVIMTSVIILLFAGGLYAGSTLIHSRKEIISPAATRVTPPEKTVSPKEQHVSVSQVESNPSPYIITASTDSSAGIENKSRPNIKTNYSTLASGSDVDTASKKAVPIQPIPVIVKNEEVSSALTLPVGELETEIASKPKKKTETEKKEVARDNTTENKKQSEVKKDKTEDQDKKKGLGEALKDIFKKKKKDKKDN